jgi:hypothetical protein
MGQSGFLATKTSAMALIVACAPPAAVRTLAPVSIAFSAGVGSCQSVCLKRFVRGEELSRETDPKRVFELSRELNKALKEQEFQGRNGPQQTRLQ